MAEIAVSSLDQWCHFACGVDPASGTEVPPAGPLVLSWRTVEPGLCVVTDCERGGAAVYIVGVHTHAPSRMQPVPQVLAGPKRFCFVPESC